MVKQKNNIHPWVKQLIALFDQQSDASHAAGAKAYLLNQFDFFGLTAPSRREITKPYFKKGLPPFEQVEQIVHDCFAHPNREMQYAAIELLAAYKKEWNKNTIHLIEYILTNKSWWDSVDHAATDLTGPYFRLFPAQIKKVTGNWNRSSNFWLQRSSLMFQKAYKKDTDQLLLSKYILRLATSKEFFVQKAIGWILREYSSTNSEWVKTFVQSHQLSTLSKREALKRLK